MFVESDIGPALLELAALTSKAVVKPVPHRYLPLQFL